MGNFRFYLREGESPMKYCMAMQIIWSKSLPDHIRKPKKAVEK